MNLLDVKTLRRVVPALLVATLAIGAVVYMNKEHDNVVEKADGKANYLGKDNNWYNDYSTIMYDDDGSPLHSVTYADMGGVDVSKVPDLQPYMYDIEDYLYRHNYRSMYEVVQANDTSMIFRDMKTNKEITIGRDNFTLLSE